MTTPLNLDRKYIGAKKEGERKLKLFLLVVKPSWILEGDL